MAGTVRLLGLIVVFLIGCSSANPQVGGKPDISPKQALKIPPPPPHDIMTRIDGKKMVISWAKSPLENVGLYRVYRKLPNGDFVKIGETEKRTFVDPSPKPNSEYAVSSVNTYGAESDLGKIRKIRNDD